MSRNLSLARLRIVTRTGREKIPPRFFCTITTPPVSGIFSVYCAVAHELSWHPWSIRRTPRLEEARSSGSHRNQTIWLLRWLDRNDMAAGIVLDIKKDRCLLRVSCDPVGGFLRVADWFTVHLSNQVARLKPGALGGRAGRN